MFLSLKYCKSQYKLQSLQQLVYIITIELRSGLYAVVIVHHHFPRCGRCRYFTLLLCQSGLDPGGWLTYLGTGWPSHAVFDNRRPCFCRCCTGRLEQPAGRRTSTTLQLFRRRLKSELFRRSLGPRHST